MIAFADSAFDSHCRMILADGLMRSIAPRKVIRSWEWICKHGRTPDGQSFDGTVIPWAEGVCDAWDDPSIREVVLIWGTRLGKTMTALQLMAKSMATNPMPGLFATADEKLAKRTARNKIYKVLSAIRETRQQLLPDHLRSVGEIRLAESTWGVAWAGSESLLADIGVLYGWANEFTKWKNRKSMEGMMLKGDVTTRFFERFKEYWHSRKIILESSPGLKGFCNIERKYLESNQCRYYVPCPNCKNHQVLKLGNGNPDEGGIVFDKLPDGRLDPDLAQRTARYVCEKCHKPIRDEQRARMMRCGKWVPKGCRIDKKGKLCGKPDRKCDIWGGQLSSLYSLQLRWGDIARKFVEVRSNPALLQVFVNDWLAETWEPYKVKSEPEDVAERLATDDTPGVMPKWSTWLFAAVDVQAEYFKWIKVAAGPGDRVAIVDRGICDSWGEVCDQCVNSSTEHADGGAALMPCLVLIDSGDGKKTDEVYRKCREWSRRDRLVIPCKGANTDMKGDPYQTVAITPGVNGASRVQKRQALRSSGVLRIRINSFYYEPIIQRWLDSRQPGEIDSLSIPEELAADIDFMRELCNGAMSGEPSKMDPDRLLWVPRWPSEPNDFRDCVKYARCAIDVKFRGNARLIERRQVANAQPVMSAIRPTMIEVDDGRRRRLPRQRMRRERMRGR
jgi:phage terminase large subunit GpA-like protein